jgi:hypothetical protein
MFRSSLQIFALVCLEAWLAGTALPAWAANLTVEQAQKQLYEVIERDALYASRLKPHCFEIQAEAWHRDYFNFVVRELHSRDCPGDLATSPALDHFRVYRDNGNMLWFDPVKREYASYNPDLKKRKP